MSKTLDVHFSSARTRTGKDDWTTPPDFFAWCQTAFGPFTLDAAADASNALCSDFFDGSQGKDGLVEPWSGVVWCNPPYSNIRTWLSKAYDVVHSGRAERVVLLVPARTDTRAFQTFAPKAHVYFLAGRLKFGGSKTGAPFPSALLVFTRESMLGGSVGFRDWRK
jgi:phage N-6-adenine-methyltransferase